MAKSTGRFRVLGVVALLVGVVGGIALWLIAGKRYDDAVESLAPAPIGCETTLVFDRTGRYTFFVETVGSVGEIDGDCENDNTSYDRDDEIPRVELNLVAEDGQAVDLDRADGPSYDGSGAIGQGVRTAQIDNEGEYVLSVSSDVDDVLVRVGRDPSSGVAPLRIGAIAMLVAGVLVAVLALLKGRDQWIIPGQPGPGPTPEWPPQGPWTRPVAPPYANPPTPPPYGLPGQGRPLPPPRPPQYG
ncbi:MAG: hypothetical protein ACR2HQ_14615 [Ilumatobacteraceae bacterium]